MAARRRFHPAIVFPGERPQPFQPEPVPTDPLAALGVDLRKRLPNLIGIGAAKCGTSALHAYMAAHPEIAMSQQKELKVFGAEGWTQRLPWYASCFDPSRRVRGETSPTYAMDPVFPFVPEQIAAVLPEPRFIYMVGDPVRRAIAHWRENRALTFERRSLQEALRDAEDPMNPYVTTSRYGHQLARYLEVFGGDRVLVVDQDDLRKRRQESLAQIFAFVGVDPHFWCPEFDSEPNAAAAKLQPNRLGIWFLDQTKASKLGRRLALLRGLTAHPLDDVAVDGRVRARLEAVLRPDIERFRDLTGRRFDHWSV